MSKLLILVVTIALCLILNNIGHWLMAGVIIACIVEAFPKRGIEPPKKFKPSWDIVGAGLLLGLMGWVIDLFGTAFFNFLA